jgi:hypothetical protein
LLGGGCVLARRDVEDDLALAAAGLAELVCASRPLERKYGIDLGAHLAALDERGHLLECVAVRLDQDAGGVGPGSPRLLEHLDGCARGHGDEQSTGSERGKRAPPGVAADEVEDDVDVAHGAGDVGGRVVDRLIDAERPQELVLVASCRADHVRAASLRDLRREVPDATGRGVNQDSFAGPHVRGVHQRLPGGQAGEGKGGGLDVGHPVGDARELPSARRHVFRVGGGLMREARHSERRDHPRRSA